MNIVTFYVPRPVEYPNAADYVAMLVQVQRSCALLGLRHVVLTDPAGREIMSKRPEAAGIETFVRVLPDRLMQACTRAQANWLREGDWRDEDTLLTGADCLVLRDPRTVFPARPDLCVTYRPGHPRYPINNGTVVVRARARPVAACLFDRVADNCGHKWGDDQRSLDRMLAPMPPGFGTFERFGLQVGFLPMEVHNDWPRGLDDDGRDSCILHFRGKGRKPLILPWAERWLAHRERLARKARKNVA